MKTPQQRRAMENVPSVCQHSDVELIGLQLSLKRRMTSENNDARNGWRK